MASEFAQIRKFAERLRRAHRHPFPTAGRGLSCPPQHGVYLIFDRAGRIAHVGRTTRTRAGLLDRLRAHLQGRSSFVVSHLKGKREVLRRGYSYSWVEVNDPRLRALVEAYATGLFCPSHIGTGAAADTGRRG
jgi:hypothetical protein